MFNAVSDVLFNLTKRNIAFISEMSKKIKKGELSLEDRTQAFNAVPPKEIFSIFDVTKRNSMAYCSVSWQKSQTS